MAGDSNWDLAGIASTIATFAGVAVGYVAYLGGGRYPVVIRPRYVERPFDGGDIARLSIEVESRTRNSVLVTSIFYVVDASKVSRTSADAPQWFTSMPNDGSGPDLPQEVPGHGVYTFVREMPLADVTDGARVVAVANGRYFSRKLTKHLA